MLVRGQVTLEGMVEGLPYLGGGGYLGGGAFALFAIGIEKLIQLLIPGFHRIDRKISYGRLLG